LSNHDDQNEASAIDRRYLPTVDFNFVSERLAVGSMWWDASDMRAAQRAGITDIALVAAEWQANMAAVVRGRLPLLMNGLHDDGKHKVAGWFERTIAFTFKALEDPDARVLVMCGGGINRAPSSAYAVLRAQGVGAEEAFDAIQTARPIARGGILYAACADAAIDGVPCRAAGHWRPSSRGRR
jgi:predicted protein tyrosine phosphatase